MINQRKNNLSLVVLAGGLGTRISEETSIKPKPMIEIGGRPILWHILKYYSSFGINNFIICCGYKGYVIKEYFANYFLHMSDVTFDMSKNEMIVHQKNVEPWKVTLVDTGEETQTGGRLKRVREYVKNDKMFCFTYGDGLSDVNIDKLLEFHTSHKKLATITAIIPPGRYGSLKITDNDSVNGFTEKPRGEFGYVNGGFFVLSPSCIDFIKDDFTSWEKEPLEDLAKKGELMAFKHTKFWQPMDTLRDKNQLEIMWNKNEAPWKIWK